MHALHRHLVAPSLSGHEAHHTRVAACAPCMRSVTIANAARQCSRRQACRHRAAASALRQRWARQTHPLSTTGCRRVGLVSVVTPRRGSARACCVIGTDALSLGKRHSPWLRPAPSACSRAPFLDRAGRCRTLAAHQTSAEVNARTCTRRCSSTVYCTRRRPHTYMQPLVPRFMLRR